MRTFQDSNSSMMLVEDQLTVLGVDGEAPSLIEDGEAQERFRAIGHDARDHIMQNPVADADGVDADHARGVVDPSAIVN